MSQTLAKPRTTTQGAPEPATKKKETNREFVEQIVVAFILAFLIRGFVAEAFVIPTGSMAPTLYGQHKEVTCPQCGEVFAVNAADEAEVGRGGLARAPQMVDSATCPNCRYRVTKLAESPTFKGDRILVMKFLYNLPRWLGGHLPSRWDVIVFHFPEEPETNYIKRLVGLPNEVIRLYFGDVLSRRLNTSDPFAIQRKPLPQQAAMQQLVWDDSHRPKAFADLPEWRRWTGDGWKEGEAGIYRVSPGGSWSSLSYGNRIPDPIQWKAALTGKPIPGTPRACLVTDMYGYNSGLAKDSRHDGNWFQPHWVGDLTVSGTLTATAGKGGVARIELVEGGVKNYCDVNLTTGSASISRDGVLLGEPATTKLTDDGRAHTFAFANVDDRLTLWVDGATPFGEGLTYPTSETHPAPTADDLRPASIAVKGCEAEVSGLVLKRDIYYTQDPRGSDYAGLDLPWLVSTNDPDARVAEALDFLSDPKNFPILDGLKHKDFPIEPGRYMMMGDNSPKSSDSRAWTHNDAFGYRDPGRDLFVEPWAEESDRNTYEVPESLIIGKAFFVYWPHGVPLWPNLGVPLPPKFSPSRDFRFPFRPYVERMKWIR